MHAAPRDPRRLVGVVPESAFNHAAPFGDGRQSLDADADTSCGHGSEASVVSERRFSQEGEKARRRAPRRLRPRGREHDPRVRVGHRRRRRRGRVRRADDRGRRGGRHARPRRLADHGRGRPGPRSAPRRDQAAPHPRPPTAGETEVPTLEEALACLSGRAAVDVEIKNIPGEPDFDGSRELAVEATLRALDDGRVHRARARVELQPALDRARPRAVARRADRLAHDGGRGGAGRARVRARPGTRLGAAVHGRGRWPRARRSARGGARAGDATGHVDHRRSRSWRSS